MNPIPTPQLNTPLAEPFSQIFIDRAEADWAFDLLCETVQHLRVTGPYDQRVAITLTRAAGRQALRVNFGAWLVLGFRGPGQSPERVDLALLAEQVAWDERLAEFPFESKEGEPEVRTYTLPLELVRPMPGHLRQAYEATLAFIARKFEGWQKATHWKQHQPELIEACTSPEQRARLFAGELTDPELKYERTRRAFELELAEEEEMYGAEGQGSRGAEEQGSGGAAVGWVERRETPHPQESGGVEEHRSRGAGERGSVEVEEAEDSGGDPIHFSEETFSLLAGLNQTPTKEFYVSHRAEFKAYLEQPFQQLFRQIAAQLPEPMLKLLETRKQTFGRILKNDFGQGSAWDFYWGAFYPKGSKRSENAQLMIWINRERLEFGFYIGDYGSAIREQFLHNCQNNLEQLEPLLQDILSNEAIVFGRHEDIIIQPDGSITSNLDITWQDWLHNPGEAGFGLSVVLPREEVLSLSLDQLAAQIAQTFSRLFPLILLAVRDDPLPEIRQYLESLPTSLKDQPDLPHNPIRSPAPPHLRTSAPLPPRPPAPPLPPYPLAQLAEESGFDESELARWVRAIERKKQVILYGPPGTGKTYVAEGLARHLAGGGNGLIELVQFHPAYAYEDFMQGLRPQARPEGGLDYPLVPGRFLEFCRQAAGCSGRSVLIIDEINRADLARVFGELMYLLEYREQTIPLAGGGEGFRIPENVRIIGTMNTADRSIALVDHALRRRFAFLPLRPNYDLLRRYHARAGTGFAVEGLIKLLKRLNRAIGDPHYEVGVTFFLNHHLPGELEDIWRMEIEPYLEEYFFDQPAQVEAFRWAGVKGEILGGGGD